MSNTRKQWVHLSDGQGGFTLVELEYDPDVCPGEASGKSECPSVCYGCE